MPCSFLACSSPIFFSSSKLLSFSTRAFVYSSVFSVKVVSRPFLYSCCLV
uniref:Uncharacterized protein n=1 Tax=Anguilla anguilla TaxID=7936 RepID=A0A0E9UUC7_ANGAN